MVLILVQVPVEPAESAEHRVSVRPELTGPGRVLEIFQRRQWMLGTMNSSVENTSPTRTLPGIQRPIERLQRAVVVSGVLLLAVVVFGLFLSKSQAVTAFDLGVDRALSQQHVVPVTDVALAIYKLFSPAGAIAITVVAALIIWVASRNWRSALTFCVVVGGSWVSSDIVKLLVNRPRPSAAALAHPYLPTPPDPTFPSGHVVFAASIAIGFIFLARNSARLALVVALGITVTVVTAAAVIYLGVHYPTDVIGSLVWAAGACTLVIALWNRIILPRISPRAQSRLPA